MNTTFYAIIDSTRTSINLYKMKCYRSVNNELDWNHRKHQRQTAQNSLAPYDVTLVDIFDAKFEYYRIFLFCSVSTFDF